jgi:hypothetical protein
MVGLLRQFADSGDKAFGGVTDPVCQVGPRDHIGVGRRAAVCHLLDATGDLLGCGALLFDGGRDAWRVR